jgi:gamma-glutamylcyclotransferase (GGCT)/AIG2-like uncharacterized protein YtfP/DNA gyrase inhibitor GyrI
MLNRVFVYGTLKPGLRYHYVAQQGGAFAAEEASIEGFDLYHLSPENYPAITEGTGRVNGWCFTYENMDLAMPFLDELEGVDSEPPDYKRIQTRAFLKQNPCDTDDIIMTWVYVFQDRVRCHAGTLSATLIPTGLWQPRVAEEVTTINRVQLGTQHLLVIENQPLSDTSQTVALVRSFLSAHASVSAVAGVQDEEKERGQVVVQFPPLVTTAAAEQLNQVGLVLHPTVWDTHGATLTAALDTLTVCQNKQKQTWEGEGEGVTSSVASVNNSDISISSVMMSSLAAGSYAHSTYRGPYYGLPQAWADFHSLLASPNNHTSFEVLTNAPSFQVFADYEQNTLAADLQTDLYIRVKDELIE